MTGFGVGRRREEVGTGVVANAPSIGDTKLAMRCSAPVVGCRKEWRTVGRVSFNTEILTAPANIRKRVIVEELLHLKLPNHGKLFKALLRAYLGD